ncbi:MAG: hypothetical protein LWX08_04350 [Deltaproteobacteria bacterium]|jgi:uncharacterized protein (UPF0332 family)|nr:hypothetical protein [Deltaproteobacteria bacterium]
MSLNQWVDNGWLRRHKTSQEEIENLIMIIDRDLKDAKGGISDDWRFGIAYNAALKLCTILLYAEGFKAEKTLQHYRTIQALPLILGNKRKDDAEYLNSCRSKRNIVEYDYVGGVTGHNADELIEFVKELKADVLEWLNNNHPELEFKKKD